MKQSEHSELGVGQVAKRSGVAISAVHFYESKGLISSRRNHGNHRRYARDVLRRIAIIKIAQRAGMPLASIRAAFAMLPENRTPTARDWEQLSAQWADELEARIQRLVQLRDQLGGCIGCGCLSLETCPLRNPSDTLAAQGPGPHVQEAQPDIPAT